MELLGAIDPDTPLLVVALHLEAEHLSSGFPVLITGVGKLAAGQAVLSVLGSLEVNQRPRALWNVGTAGALHDHLAGTHLIGSVIQHDVDGPAIALVTGEDPSPSLTLGLGPVLATGDRFIADPAERSALASRADLVDMEGYAVARAAHLLNIPVALIKQVSDGADADAGERWVDRVATCSEELGQWLKEHEPRGHIPSPST